MIKRLWSEGLVILLLFLLPAGLLLAAYQRASQVTVDVGAETQPPGVHLEGFYAPEHGDTFSFRWSQGQAQIRLTALGWGRALQLELGLVGWLDERGHPITATISVDDQVLARYPVEPMAREQYRPPRYTFLVSSPVSFSGDLTIHLQSSTFSAGKGDERHLGLAVDQLTVRCDRGGGWPPLQVLLSLQGTILLLYASARIIGRSWRMALLVAGGALLLVAIPLLAAPLAVAPVLPTLAKVITLACLSLLLVRLAIGILPRALRLARQLYVSPRAALSGRSAVQCHCDALTPAEVETALAQLKGEALFIGVILVAVTLLFFFKIVFLGSTFWGADIEDFFYPTRAGLAASFRAHDFRPVLWNPYIYAGYPLFAEGQTGTLYPLNILYALPIVSPLVVFNAQIVLHYFLSLVGMYSYTRVMQASRTGALVSAISFTFGGFMVSHLAHVSLLNAAAWLPLVFLFAELLLAKRQWRYLILTSVVLAIQVYAGHPQAMLITSLALVPYLLVRLLFFRAEAGHRAHGWMALLHSDQRLFSRLPLLVSNLVRFVLIISLIAGLTAALAAAQLLPLAELLNHSIRAIAQADAEWTFSYSLPARNLVTLVFPFYFGDPVGYQGEWNFSELALYVGILPLVLAAAAFLRPNKYKGLLLLIGGMFLLFALGGATPLGKLLRAVPVYGALRAPARYVLIVDFALATLAGLGLTDLPRVRESRRRRALLLLAVALLLSTLAYLGVESGLTRPLWSLFSTYPAMPEANRPSALQEPAYTLFFPTVARDALADSSPLLFLKRMAMDYYRFSPYLLSFGSALVMIVAYKKWPAVWLTVLCTSLVLMDLYMVTQRVNGYLFYDAETVPGNVNEQLAALFQPENGLYRVYNVRRLPKNSLAPLHIPSFDGYTPLQLERHQRYETAIQASGYRPLLLSVASVRYVVDHMDGYASAAQRDAFPRIGEVEGIEVYENRGFLPRIFLVHSARVEQQDPLGALLEGSFDPVQVVVLEKDLDTAVLAPSREDRVGIVDNGATRVVVQASSGGAGLLVLNDTYYPGWKAYVDGQETEIYRANYLFRAVYLPPGDHTVEFVYRPTAVYVGLATSLLTLTGVVSFFVGTGLASRRRRGALTKGRRKSDAALDSDSSVE